MGNIKSISFKIAVLSISLFFSTRADLLFDDHEDGTNMNEFEYYWYYRDDNVGFGSDDRPSAAPESRPSIIDVPYTTKARAGFGANFIYVEDPTDTWEVKIYDFTIDEENGNKFATMPFTFGEPWEISQGQAQPYVATGAMLCGDGKSIDLTGSEGIRFRLRSRVNDLTVRFIIQDYDIDTFSMKPNPPDGAFGYHGKDVVTTAGEWTSFEVYWEDLDLPETWGWHDYFSLEKLTKIAWKVQDASYSEKTDTLDIDDIMFIGDFGDDTTPPYPVPVPLTPPTDAQGNPLEPFATFENIPKALSPLGTYWYAFNDAEIGGNSEITLGASENESTGLFNLHILSQSGSDNEDHGAAVEFILGDAVQSQSGDNELTIKGYVGVGIDLYDSAHVEYLDATSSDNALGQAINGIYFHYMTDGNVQSAILEVSDYYDVPDADDPARKESRGSGIVWFMNLPPTGGQWVAAHIKFSDLNCHTERAAQDIPLDLTRLAKARWKVQGNKGVEGFFSVDNVYFTTATSVPVVRGNQSTRNKAFSTALVNGNIRIELGSRLSGGTLELINARGMVVGSTSFAQNKVVSFSTKALPAGAYFVRVAGKDSGGRVVSMQSVVRLVK